MSNLYYFDVDLTKLAPTASDPVTMLATVADLYSNGRMTKTEFMQVYDTLIFSTGTQIAGCLTVMKSLYNKGKLSKSEFVNAYNEHHMSWSDATWDYIAFIEESYYDGTLTLSDVQRYWTYGNTKLMSITTSSSYSAQTVSVRIVDYNHMPLVASKGSKSNAFMTLAFVLSQNGSNVGTQAAGWQGSAVRTSMNGDLLSSLPSGLREMIKTVNKQSDNGSNDSIQLVTTQDNIFIPTAIEFTGGNSVNIPNSSTSGGGTQIGSGGTQYEGYKTASLRNYGKTIWTVTSIKYYSIYDYNRHYELMETIDTSGNRGYANRTTSLGLVPHFCI